MHQPRPINCYLKPNNSTIRVGAVSYLNTVPLVWGMLHGPQQSDVDLTFSIPSVCAEDVEADKIDIGLVPVAEIARQGLEIVPGVGISATGPVRSILLFSKTPWEKIRTFAADLSSRTSVQLARVILRERFGAQPEIFSAEPNLPAMLATADAALVIGDPALLLDPATEPTPCLDLAGEWLQLTGLPFVFAAWAGKPGLAVGRLHKLTTESYAFGQERLTEIIDHEFKKRQITRELADRYLRQHIRFELGARQMEGLETFLALAGLNREVVGAPA